MLFMLKPAIDKTKGFVQIVELCLLYQCESTDRRGHPAMSLLRPSQGSLVLEGASMCLLSKCIPSALRGGKSFLNAGMMSCSVGAPSL